MAPTSPTVIVGPAPTLHVPRGCVGAMSTPGLPFMTALLYENRGQRLVTLQTGPAGRPIQNLNGNGLAAVADLIEEARRWQEQPATPQPGQLTLEIPDEN